MHCHIFLPELDPRFVAEIRQHRPGFPAFSRLLARAAESVQSEFSVERLFMQFAGYPAGYALAPALAQAEGIETTDGYWLKIEPVHQVADMDRVRQFPADSIPPVLGQILGELLEDDGNRLVQGNRGGWYLNYSGHQDFTTTDVADTWGNNLFPFMPAGEDARYWRRLMTEIQMQLYNTPESGQGASALANAVWFWGNGAMQQHSLAGETIIGGEHDLIDIASDRGATIHSEIFPQYDEFLRGGTGNARQLLWLARETDPALIEKRLLATALGQLKRGQISKLGICIDDTVYTVTRWSLLKFWK